MVLDFRMRATLTSLGALLFLAMAASGAAAQSDGDSTGSDGQELVDRYAPVIALVPQEEPCDTGGEQYAPAPADIVLDNPHVVLRQVGVGDPVLVVGPSSRDLFDMGGAFYLDFPGDAFEPGCLYESDYHRFRGDQEAVVYAHIASQDDHPDKLVVQYWFFYYYNRYNNLHEGDWEGIQLMFDVGTVTEALETEPTSIGFSQHFGGEIAAWGGSKLEREGGTHPVVYPAVGSHASYFAPALYLGRSGSQGFGCDTTLGATHRLEPDVELLPDDVDDPDDPLAWLTFEGLWGEKRFGPFSGATGPITKPRWTEPVTWHDSLRDSSVVVPDASQSIAPYISRFCNVVEFGSRQYLIAQQSPFRAAAMVFAAGLVVWFLSSRTDWTMVNPLPVVARRRLGQIITSAGRLYWSHRWKLLSAAIVQLPLVVGSTVATLLVGVVVSPLGAVGSLITGLVSAALQLSVLVLVGTALLRLVAGFDGTLSDGLSTADAYRWAGSKLPVLIPTVIRGAAIVLGLALTIVGIPWAIRQYVRYQVATATIVFEDQTSRGALGRCSQLIRGHKRWLHTALVVVTLQLLVALLGAIAGLLALIVVNGLPLGFYSVIASVGGVLVLPYLASSTALLYGNVVAESGEEADHDPGDRTDGQARPSEGARP